MLFFFINSNWYCGDVTKLFFLKKTKQNLKNPAFTNNASTVFGGTRKALVLLTLKVPKSYMVGGLEGGEKMQCEWVLKLHHPMVLQQKGVLGLGARVPERKGVRKARER